METVKIERKTDTLFLYISGEITLERTGILKQETEELLKAGSFSNLVLELSKVSFVDSSGIGFLVSLNTKIRSMGRRMYLLKPSIQIKKTLDLVQLTTFFHIVEHEAELSSPASS